MKNKNPLYVVKGKTVLEARGLVDLILKKFNLAPMVEIVMRIMNLLLSQVQDYPTFLAVKKIMDEIAERVNKLGEKWRRA